MASSYQENFNPNSTDLNYNLELQNIAIIDTETGKPIDITSISDSFRLARNKNDGTVYNKYNMDSNLLAEFIEDSEEGLNAVSCVEALGLYTTSYINDKITGKDSVLQKPINSDPTTLDITPDLEDNLTFKTYLKGGPFVRNYDNSPVNDSDVSDSDYESTEKYKRLAPHLGIGLGEATILNPQFQFNKRDDPRTNPVYTKIGRIYSSEVMNNWPIVLFQPGRIKYHTGFFKMLGLGSGSGMNETLIRTGGEGLLGVLSKLWTGVTDIVGTVGSIGSAIFGGNKVIEFRQARNLFKQYVEFLWKDLATIMGLYTDNGYCGSVSDLDLNKVIPTNIMNAEGGSGVNVLNDQFISFRCSKDIIGSETFSNSTETNPLMESMNATAAQNDEANPNSGESGLGAVTAGVKKLGLKMASSFSEQAAVLSGKGRITLPDVFSSSSFSRSFTCSFKFHYPYGDPMGKFENLYIPFLTLLTMSAPRQIGKMSYTSPFAVRVFVKNKIMINYGMVESLSVTRGGDGNDWGPDGFPKTMTVEINIKDMEPNISLPLASRGPVRMALESMFPSCGISEYLATLGGLSLDDMTHNFRKSHFKRAGMTFINAWKAKLDPSNIVSSVANTRAVSNIIGLFSSVDFDTYNSLGDFTKENAGQTLKNTANVKFAAPSFGYHFVNRSGGDGYNDIAREHKANSESLSAVSSEFENSNYPDMREV